MQIVKYQFQQHGDDRGQLVSLEEFSDIPFEIKRVYYMYDTGKEVVRGAHAHKTLEQILICIHGSCKVRMDNGAETKDVYLERPYEGLYIPNDMWREMYDFSPDAVLLVLASDIYDETDYVRDYEAFLAMVRQKADDRKSMHLRKLEEQDALYMLEWMHTRSVVRDLNKDFSGMSMEDCRMFIKNSLKDDSVNLHLAIADAKDEYMGTVSLKNIDKDKGMAEFAIAIRECAMGEGASRFAMQKMIEIGKEERGLKKIYWCLSPDNRRALRFYDKQGYARVPFASIGTKVPYSEEEIQKYIWYCV